MVDGDASLPDQSSGSVLGATGEAELDDDGQEIAAPLGPEANDDGGPPVLLIGAILAVLLLTGGVGLALYAHYNQPPPLVDIRQYR